MAGATNARRRKIFPHLDEAKKSTSDESSGNADNSDNAKQQESEASYDNAKSKKGTKQQHPSAKKSGKQSPKANGTNKNNDAAISNETAGNAFDHLLPLPLVLTVLVCSGLFWIASFRDVMATGKPILDTLGVLWGQEDADSNFLVSSYHVNNIILQPTE